MTQPYYPLSSNLEPVHLYKKGVFHPVNIGDTFTDRYRVVRKLGFGISGTVWLVEDISLRRFASLKVMAADTSSTSSELSVSRHLQLKQDDNAAHPGSDHIVKIFDTFTIEGPNGTHHCIITEILGLSLGCRLTDISEDISKRVAVQVALGVAYLHKCGVVHGDLHLKNVLLYSPKIQTATMEEVDRIYGPIKQEPILYLDETSVPPSPHLPKSLIYPSDTSALFDMCVEDIHVKIRDFGESTIIDPSGNVEKPFRTSMPVVLRAPEILFKDIKSPTTSMEVWALGVLLVIIFNDHPPFDGYEIFQGPDVDDIIARMVTCLGRLPKRWWLKWSNRARYFDEEGIHVNARTRKAPEGIDGRWLDLSKDERDSFSGVLSKIFRYNPKDRIDAEEVVRLLHPSWINP